MILNLNIKIFLIIQMERNMKKLFCILLLCSLGTSAFATHIIQPQDLLMHINGDFPQALALNQVNQAMPVQAPFPANTQSISRTQIEIVFNVAGAVTLGCFLVLSQRAKHRATPRIDIVDGLLLGVAAVSGFVAFCCNEMIPD